MNPVRLCVLRQYYNATRRRLRQLDILRYRDCKKGFLLNLRPMHLVAISWMFLHLQHLIRLGKDIQTLVLARKYSVDAADVAVAVKSAEGLKFALEIKALTAKSETFTKRIPVPTPST